MILTLKIYYEFVDRIEKSVPRVTSWHHMAPLSDTNKDMRDMFVYPFVKLLLDSFSCKSLHFQTPSC